MEPEMSQRVKSQKYNIILYIKYNIIRQHRSWSVTDHSISQTFPKRSQKSKNFKLLSLKVKPKFEHITYAQGWAVVPGQCRDPGPGPANPRDGDQDSRLRDSRDRDKNLRVPIDPGALCVPWDRDRSLRDERDRDKISRDYRGTKSVVKIRKPCECTERLLEVSFQ